MLYVEFNKLKMHQTMLYFQQQFQKNLKYIVSGGSDKILKIW